MKRTESYRGFTLIELLVVVAIVALLAGLLFPVFVRARESARQTSCLSHLRQLSVAVSSYTQDYDERYPQTHPTAVPGTSSSAEMTIVSPWRTLLDPYVRSAGMFQCPSDWGVPDFHPSSYGPNGFTTYGAAVAEIRQPAQLIYAAELQGGALVDDLSPWNGPADVALDLATDRHNGGAVYLFADGHVHSLRYDLTWSPVNLYTP
jgi:prepilin-type N-terminal cleavage/methylation domain-containing protein/prepilin-type processing-associated H-X9-DG protein